MDKLDESQQARAVALEAAAAVVAENLGKFINLGSIPDNRTYAKSATLDLAKSFERYILEGER